MRYRGALTIPAGTLRSNPATLDVALSHGVIREIELLFPAGQAGLTYVQIWHHERQIFPTTPGTSFRGDDHLITFPEDFRMTEVPYEVELHGWAPDTTLSHTIYVGFTVLPFTSSIVTEMAFVALPEGF